MSLFSCRLLRQRTQEWADLPLPVLDGIIQHLPTEDVLRMRQVCQWWKEACTGFSGAAELDICEESDLIELCAAIPKMSSITLRNHFEDFHIQPMSSCSSLRNASLCNQLLTEDEDDMPIINLKHLPPNLHSLTIAGFQWANGHLELKKLPHLTSLALGLRPGGGPWTWNLLRSMPALKVCLVKMLLLSYDSTETLTPHLILVCGSHDEKMQALAF